MFTGIVQDLVQVQAVNHAEDISQLGLDLGELTLRLQLGASVAVNGTCLTVTKVDQGMAYFDVIAETLRTTNLVDIEQGDLVNVERSFKVGDEVGGHVVSGHVTSTADVIARVAAGNDVVVTFAVPALWMKYIFHKGFVAIDGASLTVSSVNRDDCSFTVSLIPETLSRTTLGLMQVGDKANIEVDSQTVTTVETVERLFQDEGYRQQLFGSE